MTIEEKNKELLNQLENNESDNEKYVEFTYDLNDKYSYKKFLTVDFIKSQLHTKDIDKILESLNIIDEDLYDEEELESMDDFAGDVGKFHSDIELDVDDYNKIHSIVDENLPDENYKLSIEYIPESILSERGKYTVKAFNRTSGKNIEKEYTIQRDDIPQLLKTDDTNVKRAIIYDWDTLLDKPGFNEELKNLDRENMTQTIIEQKSYQSIIDMIVNDYNYIFNEYPEFALRVFRFRSRLAQEGNNYNMTNFLFDIAELINDNKFRSIITKMESESYTISLDETSARSTRKIIEDLRLSDKCNQVMLRSSIISRILIPIINDYCKDIQINNDLSNDTFKYMYNHLNMIIFSYVLRYLSVENDTNAINKLYKIVNPRVKATNYSDKVIWFFLEPFAMDDDTAIHKFINKITRTILPKLDVNKSSISFFDAVIKNMINSDFRYNFSITHKVLNVSTDEDDVNEIDKIAVNHYHKHNEATDTITQLTVQQIIDKYFKKYNLTINDVKKMMEKYTFINEFNSHLLKLFGSGIIPDLRKISTLQKMSLILILHHELKETGLPLLSKLTLAKRVVNDEEKPKKPLTRISVDISRSPDYQNIRKRYSNMIDKFDRDGYLFRLSSIYVFNFETLNLDTNEYEEMDAFTRQNINAEIFSFVTNCISR